jgi:hypothetical protein
VNKAVSRAPAPCPAASRRSMRHLPHLSPPSKTSCGRVVERAMR